MAGQAREALRLSVDSHSLSQAHVLRSLNCPTNFDGPRMSCTFARMDSRTHWENVYTTKDATQVSWYQEHPALSLQLIEHTGIDMSARIIDIGGGASALAGALIATGFSDV